jgi:putative inorganic carbon (hco3(-)) transporter
MSQFIINLKQSIDFRRLWASLIRVFKVQLLDNKLQSPLGYFLLSFLAILIAGIISFEGFKVGIVLLAAIIAIPCVVGAMLNLQFGVALVLVFAFFLQGIKRVADVPLGVALDALIGIMLFGLIVKQVKERDWSFANNEISRAVLVWIGYNLISVANPWAASQLAWVYSVRAMAGLMVLYFIIIYALKDLKYVTLLMKIWIGLATFAAIYAYIQEHTGLRDFEIEWLVADERRHHLLVQWGRTRKWSYLADPTVFGIMMAYTSVFCFVLIFGPFQKWVKIALGISCFLMLTAMVYSGTRTAYAIWPVGFLFFTLITFQRNILIVAGIIFFFGSILVMIPTSNPDLYRIQSAFKPNDIDSYQVRQENQAFIQPFIQSHPMGGGLGSTGEMGERFSPWHILAGFPPDSGFVRIAVELGWVGLLLYCWLLFTIFKVGIRKYFRTKDPRIKIYYVALLSHLFSMVVANYPQETIAQLPTSLVFYLTIAFLVKLKDFDQTIEKT